MTNPKPEVATNRHGDTVADALANYWQHLLDSRVTPPALAIATAYFNPGGYGLIADQLEQASQVRLLLGAEPDLATDLRRPRILRPDVLPDEDLDHRLRTSLEAHQHEMEADRNLIAFDRNQDALIRRLIAWLRSGRVEVKRLQSRFLHGKAFVVETDKDGVLAGSSNFTYAGLARNVELNLGHYQPYVVGEVLDWFNELWDEAIDYDLAGLYEGRFAEHLPYIVYLRMLWERYRHELDRDEEPPGLHLTGFQKDGLARAVEVLRRHNGVLIADGVGLGKTYLAGELIRQATQDRRQRVLLIAPATLRDGPWAQFLDEYFIGGIDVVSFQELAADPALGGGGGRALRRDPNEYALVVIDEAHAFRNTDTDRSATLRRLLAGSPPKKVVLLTATPVNNSLWDLYNLLAYFIRNDAAFLDAGIRSLRKHFAEAQAEDPDALSPDKLFDVLDTVAVRRTRRFVKKFYPHERIRRGNVEITISFPQPHVHRVDYDLGSQLPGFFERFAHALGVDPHDPDNPLPPPDQFNYGEQLALARYAPSAFLLEGEPDAYELQAAGLLRSGLLKRFESSAHAFARTCQKMAASHQTFLDALDHGWVLSGEALAAWERTDSDDFDPDAIARGRREPADRYDVDALREAVQADLGLLSQFAAEAARIGNDDDPKLDALIEELAAIVGLARQEAIDEADESNKRKVLLFSYYADTVEWIRQRLDVATATDPRLAAYLNRVATVTGGDDREEVMFGFAPVSADAPAGHPDSYDILVSTDVLAEGVNLQQARHIINYDLPWNPMRLVQRHGRIDRIGSPHSRVYLRCFFPTALLDELLGLEAALQRKITQAAKSIGVEGEIVPGSRTGEQVYAHTREQIEALQAEDASLFETAKETGALSGEEFRRELAQALADDTLRQQVENLPWVAGSGMATADGPAGYVFCARIGNHPRPVYRYVPLTADRQLALDDMTADTLTCLANAACAAETPRTLPDWIHDLAYDAWEAARQSILTRWIEDADPRSIAMPIPKPMREAADLLRDHPPEGMDLEWLHRLLDAVEAPYDNRTQRMMRRALDDHDQIRERVQAVIELVEELGLEPPPAIESLPEIERHDIHLVCWIALVPSQ